MVEQPTARANGHEAGGELTALLRGAVASRGEHTRPAEPPTPPPTAKASAGAGEVSGLGALPGGLPVPWETVQDLQEQANNELTAAEEREELVSEEDRRAKARSVVTSLVSRFSTLHAQSHPPLSRQDEAALRDAVFNALYRAGPLQPYLDDPQVENIYIDGDRPIEVLYHGRRRAQAPPLPGGHEAVLSWVNRMASLAEGGGEQALTDATRNISFRLPDGARVQASTMTTRPSVVIRRHGVTRHNLHDMIKLGTLSPQLAEFLRACVEAEKNILFTGRLGRGKTTLLRAAARTIPPDETVVTLEETRELFLDDTPAGPKVWAFEEQRSNGERADGRLLGEVTINDLFPHALRYNADRIIVGEVRSDEIVPMLEAMSGGGSGSMCTIHARRAHGVLGRLVQLATKAGMSETAANHLIAESVDLVVYLDSIDETKLGGQHHRFVTHVYEVHDELGDSHQPPITDLFRPVPGEPRAVFETAPSWLDELVERGRFDPGWLRLGQNAWAEQPLRLVRPR